MAVAVGYGPVAATPAPSTGYPLGTSRHGLAP